MRAKEENIPPVLVFAWRFDERALCRLPCGPLYGHLLLRTLTAAPPPTEIAAKTAACNVWWLDQKVRINPCQGYAAVAMG